MTRAESEAVAIVAAARMREARAFWAEKSWAFIRCPGVPASGFGVSLSRFIALGRAYAEMPQDDMLPGWTI